jgi:signal transduction histidine kinase
MREAYEPVERIRREVMMPLEALVDRVARQDDEVPAELKTSLELMLKVASESFAETNHASGISSLDDAWRGWEQRLEAFARDGGEVRMQRLGQPPRLGGDAARQLFLAVREAIGNAIRHAAASRIEVLLVPWQNGCAVTVADNGRGIGSAAAGGIGLETMRRRMTRCGGELLLHPADGTVVEFRLPRADSDGVSDLRADLAAYLHDVLAQGLVAESMRWEIARESCPPSALRSRFDQCQHELRRIAVAARGLSHELALP